MPLIASIALSTVLTGCASSVSVSYPLYSEIYPLPEKPMYDPLPSDPYEALKKSGMYLINEIEYSTKLETWIKYSEEYYKAILVTAF